MSENSPEASDSAPGSSEPEPLKVDTPQFDIVEKSEPSPGQQATERATDE